MNHPVNLRFWAATVLLILASACIVLGCGSSEPEGPPAEVEWTVYEEAAFSARFPTKPQTTTSTSTIEFRDGESRDMQVTKTFSRLGEAEYAIESFGYNETKKVWGGYRTYSLDEQILIDKFVAKLGSRAEVPEGERTSHESLLQRDVRVQQFRIHGGDNVWKCVHFEVRSSNFIVWAGPITKGSADHFKEFVESFDIPEDRADYPIAIINPVGYSLEYWVGDNVEFDIDVIGGKPPLKLEVSKAPTNASIEETDPGNMPNTTRYRFSATQNDARWWFEVTDARGLVSEWQPPWKVVRGNIVETVDCELDPVTVGEVVELELPDFPFRRLRDAKSYNPMYAPAGVRIDSSDQQWRVETETFMSDTPDGRIQDWRATLVGKADKPGPVEIDMRFSLGKPVGSDAFDGLVLKIRFNAEP